jgi:hypothetical protein
VLWNSRQSAVHTRLAEAETTASAWHNYMHVGIGINYRQLGHMYLPFLQGSTLLLGAGLSLLLSKRIASTASLRALAPQAAMVALFTAELWSLILPS